MQTDEQIRAKAFQIWLARIEAGQPGDAEADWLTAEAELNKANLTPLQEASQTHPDPEVIAK